jgi:hypothetical protein
MRTMSTQMGSTAGNNGRTEGLPEVQEPVLEHAPTEAQNPQVTGVTLAQNSGVVKSVNSPENGQVWRLEPRYKAPEDGNENPDNIRGVRAYLPNGRSAWFCRIDGWVPALVPNQ